MANIKDTFGDERLKKDAGVTVRGSRENEDTPRTHDDGGSLSAEQRRRLLRQEWVHDILPRPPAIPGFHLCWLSTTNSTDPIHKRMQMGYQPVKFQEVPGFHQYKVEGGEFDNCIACNEMLLFKVSEERYQDLMTIYHHDMPLEQEQSIYEKVSSQGEIDSNGRQLNIVEGDFNQLGRSATRTPHFA